MAKNKEIDIRTLTTRFGLRLTVTALAVTSFAGNRASIIDAEATSKPTKNLKLADFDHNGPKVHGGYYGNGRRNSNAITVNSPVFNRGYQHSNDAAVDGTVNKQTALCKRWWRHCNIVQKMTVIDH